MLRVVCSGLGNSAGEMVATHLCSLVWDQLLDSKAAALNEPDAIAGPQACFVIGVATIQGELRS